jgi:hypothetical protein
VRPRVSIGAFFLVAAACKLPAEGSSHASATHVIAESDNLKSVEISVGDFIESPHDDAFEWRMVAPSPLFEAVDPLVGQARYRAAEKGSTRLIVDGDPKCLKLDAACGISRREWTIFLIVR